MQKRDCFHEDYTTKQKNLQKRKKELDEFSEKHVEMYKGALIKTDPKARQKTLGFLRDQFIDFIKTYDEILDDLEQDKQKLKNRTEEEIQTRKRFDVVLYEKLGIRTEITIEYNEVFTSIDRNIEETLKQRRIDGHGWTIKEIQEERDKASIQVKDIKRELSSKWHKISFLRNISVDDAWRLGVDGRYQQSDGLKFEHDEKPSFIAGTLRLLNFMLDGLCIEGLKFDGHNPRKLDGQYLQEMHDIAIAGMYREVKEGKAKEGFQIGYRGFLGNWPGEQFGWGNANYTERGHEELREKFKCRRGGEEIDPRYGEAGHPVGNSCLDPFYTFYNNRQCYMTKKATWHECLTIANAIIDKCYDEINKSSTPDEKLTAIVRCCQDLEQAHLLPDGNLRTIAFGVLPKLLLEIGECPPILRDASTLDGYDVETLKAKIREGQETFRTYVNSIRV